MGGRQCMKPAAPGPKQHISSRIRTKQEALSDDEACESVNRIFFQDSSQVHEVSDSHVLPDRGVLGQGV